MTDDTPDLRATLQNWSVAYGTVGDGVALDSGDASADQIEAIVRRMEQQGRWKEARVLRNDLALQSQSEQQRLHGLSRMGVHMSRASYYAYLKSAMAYVEGALSADAANEEAMHSTGHD